MTYYHVTGTVEIVIEADSPEEALSEANEWYEERVFDFRDLEVS
jgi:hypothetical protein